MASGTPSSDGQLRWAVLCCCPSVAHGSRTILGHLDAPTSSPGPCAFPLPEQAVSLASASQCPSPQRRLGRGWRPLHRTRTPPRHRHTSPQPLDPVVSSGDLRPSDGGKQRRLNSKQGCAVAVRVGGWTRQQPSVLASRSFPDAVPWMSYGSYFLDIVLNLLCQIW